MTSLRSRLIGVGLLVVVAVVAVVLLVRDPASSGTSGGDASQAASVTTEATSTPTPGATDAGTADAGDEGAADGAASGDGSATGQEGEDGEPGEPGEPQDPLTALEPVALDDAADFGTGVSARIVDIAAVRGEGVARGEIAGPALLVTVRLVNDSDDPVNLSAVVVNTYYGPEATPAVSLFTDERSASFSGSLGPGERARGTYVFTVPREERGEVLITVNYGAGEPLVGFSGAAPA